MNNILSVAAQYTAFVWANPTTETIVPSDGSVVFESVDNFEQFVARVESDARNDVSREYRERLAIAKKKREHFEDAQELIREKTGYYK